MPGVTISKRVHAHTYTQAPVHTIILTTHNFIYSQFRHITNTERQQRGTENMAGLELWKKKCLEVRFEAYGKFLSERKGKVIPCRGSEDRKGAGTNSGDSGTRNLEAKNNYPEKQSGEY